MYRDKDQGLTREENTPRDEMLLDVCLEEVLSGQSPPDLCAQIMAQIDGVTPPPVLEPPVVPPPVEPPVQSPVAVTNGRLTPERRVVTPSRRRIRARNTVARQWTGLAITASVLLLGLGIVAWHQADRFVASTPGTNDPERVPTTPANPSSLGQTVHNSNGRRAETEGGRFSEPLFGAAFPPVPEEQAVPWVLPYSVQPQDDANVVAFVNSQIASATRGQERIDDDAWCRQVFQQIVGREPTSVELVDFAADSSANKRVELVDRLLEDENYRQEYASHWANVWTDELLGAEGETPHPQGESHRGALRRYLYESLHDGKPHDEVANELIASDGSAESNGATAFLLAKSDGSAGSSVANVTADVSRVFLGHNGRCAQCHDGNGPSQADKGLSQQQFWQLAAFFEQTKVETDKRSGKAALIDSDYVGLSGDGSEAETFYETLNKERRIAYPEFTDGTPINPDGRVDVVDRREELAKLIVASEDFAQATVDVYWRNVTGAAGAIDSGAQRRLTQGLAEQFAAHDFDHRRLLRWIILSDAAVDVDASGSPLYENALIALNDVRVQGRPISRSDSVLFARLAPPQTGSGQDPAIFVPAAVDDQVKSENRMIRRLQQSDINFSQKVRHVFLYTLDRQPSEKELGAARKMLASHEGNVRLAIDDIHWAITQSAEFKAR